MERFFVYWIVLVGWCASLTTQHTNNTNQFRNDRQGSFNHTLEREGHQSNNDSIVLVPVTPNSTENVSCTSFEFTGDQNVQNVHMDGRISCTCSVPQTTQTVQCNGELYSSSRDHSRQFLQQFMKIYRNHPHRENEVLDLFIQNLQIIPPKQFQDAELYGLTISSAGSLEQVSDKAFQGLESSLEILSLSNNKLENIPVTSLSILTGLIQLDLSDNHLSSVHSLPSLSNLEYLDISRNELRTLASGVFQSTPHLKTLNLANNRLDVSSMVGQTLHHLTYLQTLDISNNQFNANLSGPDLNWIPSNLKSLDLSSNNLTGISQDTFSSLKSLSQLNLQDNDIQSIDGGAFRGMENLKILDLSHNSILTLCDNSLEGLTSLKELNLSFNVIQVLSSKWLIPVAELKTLYLNNNDMTTVDNGALDSLQQLIHLNIKENPLNCDCELVYLVTWSAGRSGIDLGRCATPGHLVNALVSSFNLTKEGCGSSESIQYFGADPLYEANSVSNSSNANYQPQIFVKSADFQEKEGLRLSWRIRNVRGNINCDKIYIFQETESSFEQIYEDDLSCQLQTKEWLRFPSKQRSSAALVETADREYTLINTINNQMLKSGRKNASQIICIKISIDDQIYPGCTGNLEFTNLKDNQNIKLGASLLDQEEVSVLSMEAQSDLSLNANVSKDNSLYVYMNTQVPTGIQDQCSVYLTVNTPGQPNLGSKRVSCNETFAIFEDLPRETVFRVCALLKFSKGELSNSHKLRHSMQRKGHCVLALIRYRDKSILPLMLTLVFMALGIACLSVLYLIIKPRKDEDQGRRGKKLNKITLFIRLLTQRLILRRNHTHLEQPPPSEE